MKFRDLKQMLGQTPLIDVRNIINLEPNFHRRRLYEWQQSGLIKKIANNFYIFTDYDLDESSLYFIANKIYAPSYISLESALYHYDLIPETVYQVTSVAARKTNKISSEIADFSYRHLKPGLFFGYQIIKKGNFSYQIAEAEKALLDFFYLRADIKSKQDVASLRINKENFRQKIEKNKMEEYLRKFNSPTMNKKIKELFNHIKNNDQP